MEPIVQVQDENTIAKQRFDNFRLGGGRPASTSGRHAHKRSHSRNLSISSSVSAISLTSSTTSQPQPMPSHDLPSSSSITSTSTNKRNSHHRRRSSVSTRHESAEMMGVPVPDLPLSSSSDNINLGEKDSIRRRALLALEGKTDHSFTKVEIPELTTPVLDTKSFDFGRQNSFLAPNAIPSFGPSLGNSSKRDSFKLLAASSSSKDQLGTLVEEEEEEEESEGIVNKSQQTPVREVVSKPEAAETKSRVRPSGLNLRPLSLTAKVTTVGGLPTPVLTPSPRSGLRALALSHSPTDSEESLTSFTFRPSTSAPHVPLRRSSLSSNSDSEDSRPGRRSSIGYKSSSNGLITPSMTPTFEHHRFSAGNSIDEQLFHRPLSTSEQHFLFKQHNALLARITDLERALSSRPVSRPQSCVSDVTSIEEADSSMEPTDEMLQLVADLKAERDDLNRDVEGWRTRVAGLEKQSSLLAQRLDTERREAWVARSRLGLLEVEKTALERSCDAQTKYANEVQRQYQQLQRDAQDMKETLKEVSGARDTQAITFRAEISQLTSALSDEQLKVAALEEELAVAKASIIDLTSNQRQKHHAVALESCSTIAEEHQKGSVFGGYQPFMSGNDEEDDEEEDPLANYEDEDELDATIQSSSSFGSDDFQFPRKNSHLPSLSRSLSGSPVEDLPTPVGFSAPLPVPSAPTHTSRNSLSKVWTFPKMMAAAPARPVQEDDVDHFFGCLEDSASNPSSPTMPSVSSYETSKGLFAQGFKVRSQYFMESEDEELEECDPPFMLPNGVGVTTASDPVDPYDTDEDAVLGEVGGGIMITVTPCETEEDISALSTQPEPVKDVPSAVAPQIVVDESSPRAPSPEITITPSSPEVSVRSPSPSSIPRRVKVGVSSSPPTTRSPPSSIPRAVAKPTFISSPDLSKSSPPRASQDSVNQSIYSTPPAKRLNAQAAPWFPAPSTPSKSPMKPLNRQLPRKAPLLPSNARSTFSTNTTHDLSQEMTGSSNRSSLNQNQRQHPSSAVMSSIDWTQSSPLPPTLPSPSTSGSSLSLYSSAFSSLSSISTFLPLSWPASPDLQRTHETTPISGAVNHALQASGPKYVGRERQLEKLRLRMMRDGSSKSLMDSCKNCEGKTVFL